MSIVDRIKYFQPRRTECVVLARPLPLIVDEFPDPGGEFHVKGVFDADDRHLRELEGDERCELARTFFAKGGFAMLAIHKPTDKAISKMWVLTYSPTPMESMRGIMPIKLAHDELFLLDLWTHPDYRRQSISFTLAYEVGRLTQRMFPQMRWVYAHVHNDNEASKNLMMLVYGMWEVQKFTEVEVGRYWVTVEPGSAHPNFGPFSRKGRHSGDGLQVPGRPRSGELYRDYHHKKGFTTAPFDIEVVNSLQPGPDWYDNDHPIDSEGNLATPETMPREYGDN